MFFGVEFYDFGIEMFFHKSHIYEVLLAFYKLIQERVNHTKDWLALLLARCCIAS
jgi:hypothetical protein